MLYLCEITYQDIDLDRDNRLKTYTDHTLISATNLTELSKRITDYFGTEIISLTIEPYDDLLVIPEELFNQLKDV